jgi:hypothetical protein
MPVEKESKIAAWMTALREWTGSARVQLGEWWEAIKEEPALIWQTTAVRYAAYGAGGLVALILFFWVLNLVAYPLPQGAAEPANTANFDVICTTPGCGHHFVIVRKFGFHKFPVTCPKCGNKTAYHAVRSTTGPDAGEWVVRK